MSLYFNIHQGLVFSMLLFIPQCCQIQKIKTTAQDVNGIHRLNGFLIFSLISQSCLQRPRTDWKGNINRRFSLNPLFHPTQVHINYNSGGCGTINRCQPAHGFSILMRARAYITFQICLPPMLHQEKHEAGESSILVADYKLN